MRHLLASLTGLAVVSSLTVSGCTKDGNGGGTVGRTGQALSVQLTPLTGGCTAVVNAACEAAIDAANRQIDALEKSYLDAANDVTGARCGWERGGTYGAPGGGASSGAVPAANASDDSSRASQVSQTNNQVAGVDEADFIKNDDKYIYAAVNGALRIVDAYPAVQAHEVSKTPLDGTPLKLFVDGDRALVYASIPASSTGSSSPGVYYPSNPAQGCEYAYEQSCFDGDGTSTRVTVFDIHDRAAPRLVRTIDFSGSLIAARKIGHAVHTVVTDAPISFDTSSVDASVNTCDASQNPLPRDQVLAAYEAKRQALVDAIRAASPRGSLPTIRDGAATPEGDLLAACDGYFRASQQDEPRFTTLHSVDMVADGPATTATVLSRSGAVYASAASLYMAVTHQEVVGQGWYDGFESADEVLTVHAFRIGDAPAVTRYAGSGITDGHLLNQFAMDEKDGYLRVATTNGYVPSPNVASELSIFEAAPGGGLTVVGKVGDIAPGEDIRSVRFDGDKGFVVTFKKTDPLFAFDLSNPRAPALVGSLEIPGFSTYMHLMDATHLLTIGYDADDQGTFAWFNGVRLQIFDVSDIAHPRLVAAEDIGTRGSSSQALENHYAFTYYAPKHLLALPMTVCEGGGNGVYGDTMTFSGLMVYDVDAQAGFHLRGKIAHPITATGGYDNAACTNWWTNASSEVKRSVIMDNDVYSISQSVIKVDDLDQLGTDLAQVPLK